jgi:predicted RND superfamily exporter protein
MTRYVCVEPLATAVDYACILSVMLARLREGCVLSETCYGALQFTGKVVMLSGVTPAIGVITWGASPIKIQADMRWLLAFMFRWNILGALVLLPTLAHFLLKPSAPQPSAAAKASVQLSGETA